MPGRKEYFTDDPDSGLGFGYQEMFSSGPRLGPTPSQLRKSIIKQKDAEVAAQKRKRAKKASRTEAEQDKFEDEFAGKVADKATRDAADKEKADRDKVREKAKTRRDLIKEESSSERREREKREEEEKEARERAEKNECPHCGANEVYGGGNCDECRKDLGETGDDEYSNGLQ